MELSRQDKSTLFSMLRQVLYFSLCGAMMYGIEAATKCFGPDIFDENRLIENLQCTTLLASGILFLAKACLCKRHSTVLALCSSLALLGTCREMDNILDKAIPIISWRIGFLFIFIAIVYTMLHARDFLQSFLEFTRTPAFFTMCSAMIIIGPVAQLIGHKTFLQAALPSYKSLGQIKELFEECAESIGYLLLFLSAIEACISLEKNKN